MNTIPLGLKQALESGECVLFIGAGIGRHLIGVDGKAAPDAADLAQELALSFGVSTPSKDLAKVAQIVEGRKGRSVLEDYLRKRLANLEPDKDLRWLFNLRWRAIFTTNRLRVPPALPGWQHKFDVYEGNFLWNQVVRIMSANESGRRFAASDIA